MAPKKKKKFIPSKTCRYLPGQLSDILNLVDLYEYNCHRFRVYSTKPVVDCAPSKMNPYELVPHRKLLNAFYNACKIDRDNQILVGKMNHIHRNGGVINSFNPNAYASAKLRPFYWKAQEELMAAINKDNKSIYQLIMKAKTVYPKKAFDKFWKEEQLNMAEKCVFPMVITKKKDYDLLLSKEPSISFGLDKVDNPERPQCFLEFRLKDGEYMGKIIIECYQDYVPVTVQNFLALCKGDKDLTYKDCLVHRIVRRRFIETGDITHNTGRGGMSIYGKTFPEEKHVLKHTRAGVVSMKRIPYTENNSQFLISLNENHDLDHKHVVFGKVVRGIHVIFKIETYGRKIGKPYAEIIICNCGVIESDEKEEN